MDTLSHALWGKGFFGYRSYSYWSLFFGALPDLSSFGLYFIFNLLFDPSNLKYGKPELDELPNWVFYSYDISHSLLVSFFVILVVYLISKNYSFIFVMFEWPLHILLDFPFHTAEYFPTPVLWPLFDVKFDGISWADPLVWIPNFTGIFLLFLYRYIRKKKLKS